MECDPGRLENQRRADLVQDMLRHAHLVASEPKDKIETLITAANVLIEREVGRGLAMSLLMAVLEPQLQDWCRPAPGEPVQ